MVRNSGEDEAQKWEAGLPFPRKSRKGEEGGSSTGGKTPEKRQYALPRFPYSSLNVELMNGKKMEGVIVKKQKQLPH